jgi:hypothetical protein
MKKPKIIQQIQGDNFELHKVSLDCPLPLTEVVAFNENKPKYLLDEQDRLIGLNLAATGLNDDRWQEIVSLLKEHAVHLQALNLCENQLENFVSPPGIAEMTALDLEDNPLEYPPPEIIKQGSAAVLRFVQDAESQGTQESFEVKMLIVGEGEAGKTTLWNLLQNPEHPVPLKQDSTVGIQIKEGWEFSHLDRPNTRFFVNLWDFGGQEIQYMTHQFFLTRRSFYVLLANGRSESPNFPYWLNIINVLGCDPKQKEKLPVLVVINEKGNRNPAPPYDSAEVERQYPALDLIRINVDFQEKGKQLEALNEEIRKMLCRRITHLPMVIPRSWNEVRTEIRTLRKSVNHITKAQFEEICAKYGIADPQRQTELSRFLHDLGFILHFQEIRLKHFIVLNPNWAVNAVYAVLDNQHVKDFNQGRFNEKLLQDIWTEKGFSEDEQANLTNLMLKDGLEICFDPEDSNGEKIFIAPQLLQEEQPAGACWIDSPENLRYVYEYPFMPKGIIGRLIVRLHEYIESCTATACECGSQEWSEKMVWKNGVYLHKDDCRARIRFINDRQQERKIIKIEVQGKEAEDRKYLLRDIRRELDFIHDHSFPSLKFFKRIPCNCEECRKSLEPFEHDYAELKKRKELKRKDPPKAECRKSFTMVPVQQLLDGVVLHMERFAEQAEKKENSGQAPVVIHNHPPPSSHQTPVDPAKNPWYRHWLTWIVTAIGILAGLAEFTGYSLSDILKRFQQ